VYFSLYNSVWLKAYLHKPNLSDKAFLENFRQRFRVGFNQFTDLVKKCEGSEVFGRWFSDVILLRRWNFFFLVQVGVGCLMISKKPPVKAGKLHRNFFHHFITFGSTVLFSECKMKCYIKESKKSEIYHELREAANIPEGSTESEDGTTLFGLRTYGVPIGSEVFVTEWLKIKGERIRSNMLEIGNLVDPNRIASRHIPSCQCLWLLILNCLQFKGNYFVRNIPPQFTEEFCTTLDSAIDKLMGQCFSLKNEELSTFNKIRVHLTIRLGGLGVRVLTHVRYAEFIGGVMDGIPPLLPQHHDDGELHGKLNKLYVEHWIGGNSHPPRYE